MTNVETILNEIESLNESHSMDFKQWMIWGITKVAITSALILDNIENMNGRAKDEMDKRT